MNILSNELLPSTIIAKSSAYANTSYAFSFDAIIKSFIYISNNNGDIKLPCNTPLFKFIISELYDIVNFVYEYINLIVLINLLSIP